MLNAGLFRTQVLVALVLIAFPAVSQAVLDTKNLEIGGEIRGRYEFRDDADFRDREDDTLNFVGSRIRLHLGYRLTPDLFFFFQMQDSRVFGSETSTASNEDNLDLHQGYLRIENLGPWRLTLGRQELAYGDQRLIGNFGWSNVGRSFDAVRIGYDTGRARTDLWVATVRKFANTSPDPAFAPGNRKEQTLFGLYHTWLGMKDAKVEPYLLFLWDTGSGGGLTDPAGRDQRRLTAGIRFAGELPAQGVDYGLEGAFQYGGMQSRDIRAYAFAARTGWTAPVGWSPRIGVEYDRASGDDDPSDGRFETFENLFPTNHIHYGIMDYVGWRNMQDLRFSLGWQPWPDLEVAFDYHLFWLAEKADHWYRASGQIFQVTPAGNTENELGRELDLVIRTVLKEKVRCELGYAHFFAGDYLKRNASTADDSDFAYFQVGAFF